MRDSTVLLISTVTKSSDVSRYPLLGLTPLSELNEHRSV